MYNFDVSKGKSSVTLLLPKSLGVPQITFSNGSVVFQWDQTIISKPHNLLITKAQGTEISPLDIFPQVGDDLWKDAAMPEVLKYLFGGKSLELPEEWRRYVPTVL